MIEVLEFIFQSFWHWVGTAVLLGIVFGNIAQTLRSIVYYRGSK